ncbi:MAG: DUF167 domain-containing protein [Candidatus Magnetoovum sp. WYHC-5]|nr:DUF167 domain-containing protein [Candidatus Magnetoovum sp. WYHC-5]
MEHYKRTKSGIIVNIRVISRASRNEIAGVLNGELRIKLTATPTDGQANKQLIEFLCDYLSKHKIKKSDISILKGTTTRHKLVEIKGLDSI